MASPDKKQVDQDEKKVEEKAAVPEVKKVEPPKELEEDAKKDSSAQIKDTVKFLTPDTTMNVLPSTVGNMLMPMTEGGLAQLVSGARASVGVKSGRYMFEVKIVEEMNQRPFVRVGFAAEGSLFLGEDDNSICFENIGQMVCNRKKTHCGQKFNRDVVVAVLLNLDEKSPNFNTISLFRDGKRACQPQALPENLKGKTLFPAASFQAATVHFNFGAPIVPLPFKCRGVQEAAANHAVVTKYAEPADGKYTALFPVSLPDEGTFDWVDSFLEKNPGYTEISNRSFANWGLKSGVHGKGPKDCNDRPGNVALHDVPAIKKTLMDLAALQPRNFVIMEVKGNLLKDDRAKALAKFNNPVFKTVAEVIVSEPPSSFKKIVQALTLKAKQDKSDQEHKAKFATEKREWGVRKKTKETEKAKKKAQKENAKRAEEAKKKREEAVEKQRKEMAAKKAAAEAAAEGKPAPEEEKAVEDEKKEEEPKAAAESEEEPEEPEEPEPVEPTAPTVALTAEDKNARFFKHPVTDLVEKDLNLSFTKFSLPEAGEFGEVKYSWVKEKDAAAYMKKWILDRKQTTRVEDITPSAWFKQRNAAWQTESGKWQSKQKEYRAAIAKKAREKQEKAQKKLAAERKAKMEAEKKAKEAEEKKAKEAEEKKEGDAEAKEAEAPAAVEEAPEAAVVEEEMEEAEEPEIDFDGVDVFGAEDIMDIGGKVPLFRDFGFEDFAMMALRFELHLLAHSFAKDCNDPDRTGVHLDHLPFYYQKYYGKALNYSHYGVQTAAELLALVNDCIVVKGNCIDSVIPGDLESAAVFAKVTEAARRERILRVDMGEEACRLKIKQEAGSKDGQGQGQGQKRAWDHRDGGKGGQKGGWSAGGKGGDGGWAAGGKGGDGGWAAGGKGGDFGKGKFQQSAGGRFQQSAGASKGWGKDGKKDGKKQKRW